MGKKNNKVIQERMEASIRITDENKKADKDALKYFQKVLVKQDPK